MNATDIIRIKPQAVSVPANQLLDEAASLLGYKRPEKSPTPGRLYDALAALEIEILDARSVERYMLVKLFEAASQAQANEHALTSWNSTVLRYGFGHSLNVGASWAELPIDQFTRDIPEFVLNKAVQIKQAIPEVELRVHFLSDSPDPFLVARLKIEQHHYESYYVEVWDEPEFRA